MKPLEHDGGLGEDVLLVSIKGARTRVKGRSAPVMKVGRVWMATATMEEDTKIAVPKMGAQRVLYLPRDTPSHHLVLSFGLWTRSRFTPNRLSSWRQELSPKSLVEACRTTYLNLGMAYRMRAKPMSGQKLDFPSIPLVWDSTADVTVNTLRVMRNLLLFTSPVE